MTSAITVTDLHKSFGALEVLKGVSLNANEGEVITIIGASGSGKSTLLRCIPMLTVPDAGEVTIGGEAIRMRIRRGHREPSDTAQVNRIRASLGFVFQNFNLWPHMTVLQNVMAGPLIVKKMAKADAEPIARDLLGRVGLGAFTARYPRELSGGQQQRVAIARAMAMQPAIMLFDEVTSALDPELVGEVLDVMKQLAIDGTTMIVVTHEMNFARDVADRVVVMDAGQVVEQGKAEEVLLAPKNPRTASFLARFHSTIGERKSSGE